MRWVVVPLSDEFAKRQAKINVDAIGTITESPTCVSGTDEPASVLWIGGASVRVDIPYARATEILCGMQAANLIKETK